MAEPVHVTPTASSPFPLPLAMLLLATALGIAQGLSGSALLQALDQGFGAALGEFALILIPSFALAGAVAGMGLAPRAPAIAVALAPLAGAAMVCPDTAYAALAPVSGPRKFSTLLGAYAGFKLLVPAGPAIVAIALGAFDDRLIVAALPIFIVAWATGLLYARRHETAAACEVPAGAGDGSPWRVWWVFALLIVPIALGLLLRPRLALAPLPDFLLGPKGALLLAATAALWLAAPAQRPVLLDAALRRTAPLLLTIGTASALGAMLVRALPMARVAAVMHDSGIALPMLFVFTATFKLLKGSSMATFAGTSGIVAAALPALHVSPVAAVLAMCCGAFVSIAPNDSLYWLARQDVPAGADPTRRLFIGPLLQGTAGLLAVLLLDRLHWFG